MMNNRNPKDALNHAIELLGGPGKAALKLTKPEGTHLTRQGVVRWIANGRLPTTDYSGKTNYAEQIQTLLEGEVTAEELCPGITQSLKAQRAA